MISKERIDYSLNGRWELRKGMKGKVLAGHVPGDVYGDLIAAAEIPDPFYRDNELALQWIGESDWSYAREFDVDEELLSRKYVYLRCEGLDTFAEVTLNGKLVAKTDNMFRVFEWDVKKLLKKRRNRIRVVFRSVLPYIRQQMERYPKWQNFDWWAAYPGWVRKEQCNFGWDWGIKAVGCGIWKDIGLVAYDSARLDNLYITQQHEKNHVNLEIDFEVSGKTQGLIAEVIIHYDNKEVTRATGTFSKGSATLSAGIKEAKLWWPNNMGPQALYTVVAELRNQQGVLLDQLVKRIGLRTIALDRHADEWGESFQFVVNGVPFFAKGANWIPMDAVLSRRSAEAYHNLVADAVASNMNMLRVWGGGIYEDDSFYDACDELGICVWQDFMFACGVYPTFEKGFNENVRAEVRDAIKRLRHHASLVLWCGNNELEMMNVNDAGWDEGYMPWDAYCKLFDELIPEQVNDLSPDIPYWPSSPHSPQGDRSKHRSSESGDAHLWILCAGDPFRSARGMGHRFASEFGYQSFPHPRTIESYTTAGDRNISSRIMELHQRAPEGNISLFQRMLKCFALPSDIDHTAILSQIFQGTAVKEICEHFRRQMPRCMGTLYWQLNDCWPVASWSSIDYAGQWKALQFMARHFFAPVLISGVEDLDRQCVDIFLTSDRAEAKAAELSWTVTDCKGRILCEGTKTARAPAGGSRKVKTLNLKPLLKTHQPYDLLVWLEAEIEGEAKQCNLVFLAAPKHLELSHDPGIKHRIRKEKDGTFELSLTAKEVALWVWIELPEPELTLSDNFIHLRPGVPRCIKITAAEKTRIKQLEKALQIKSLIDTYSI